MENFGRELFDGTGRLAEYFLDRVSPRSEGSFLVTREQLPHTFGVETENAAAAAFESPEGVALNEDTGRFMDWPSVLTIPLAELGIYRR
ncbi:MULTISPECIES: hypothetical protein [Arthrobacter]|uniref:Uncharacterized protein n=1 Tax=Arthrobacter terricola TaxID=2547396 RepID=A0A4R5KCD0_9MICC|nr:MULTISPECIES: hypothetical protein [Arthrobacter]MBT8162258.1 hypothetical protein [Arthrobacter sp. GN70]TDF92265.1 hypothetical protein E1809_18660 [Arthrobacter terricola]